MKRAAAYAAELDDVEVSGERPEVFVPKVGKHRPPESRALEYKAGMKRAAAYAAELDSVEVPAVRPSVFLPKTGLHRPLEKHSKKPSKVPPNLMSSMGPSHP